MDVTQTIDPATTRRRISSPRLTAIILAVVIAASTAPIVSPASVDAAPAVRYLDCRSLAGAGSYSNPKRIGAITQVTIITNCPPLTSGAGFNVAYFSFSLNGTPSSGSYAMTYYQRRSSAESGVHPRVAFGARTVKNSLSARYYFDGTFEGFYHSMSDLWAGTSWRLGAEKLSSPLGSTVTAWYHIVLAP